MFVRLARSLASSVAIPSESARSVIVTLSLYTLSSHLVALSGSFEAAATASRTLIFQFL